jgi:hypothetical protein
MTLINGNETSGSIRSWKSLGQLNESILLNNCSMRFVITNVVETASLKHNHSIVQNRIRL